MDKKIKVAFIYKECDGLSPNHYATTHYHFFMNALKRNKNLDVIYYPTCNDFDVSKLENNTNVILLFEFLPSHCIPEQIRGIEKMNIPVICKVGDAHRPTKSVIREYHDKYKIDAYFSISSNLFYSYYPSNYKHKEIFWGVEPSLYQNLTPLDKRIKTRILNSGAIGNAKFHSRIINSIMTPRSNAYNHYKLRTICTKLPYVDYTSTLVHEYVGDKYPLLLQKYAAAIAATTFMPTMKYLEIPAAGCLAFMEVTDKNNARNLGFIDGESAIFINEKNYKSKFEEYLSDVNNLRWKQIANAGREYTLKNLNNDRAADSLVDLMKELLK